MSSEHTTQAFADRLDEAARCYSESDRMSALFNFIDGVGTTYAGYRRPEIHRLLSSQVVEIAAEHPSWLVGNRLRARPSDAVLLNAMAGHLDDFDDDEALVSIAHVTIPTLAAVLAAASTVDTSGKIVLNSYLSGVETMVALGAVLNPEHYMLGWHASATLGVFGATMASAHVLGLSSEQKATALSFASTASSGMRSAFGSSAKPWQVAAAARDGFNAALLARSGLDANASLFGRMSLTELYGGNAARIDAAFSRIGRSSPFDDPGVTIKAYPCCTAAHTAMEACEAIRHQMAGRAWSNIESVEVDVGRTIPSILAHDMPATALEGKFSMRFCAAVALCLPSAELEAFVDENLNDPAIRHVMDRVKMRGLPEQDDPFLCHVRVRMADGSSYSESIERTKGSPERPYRRDDIEAKFGSLCRGADADAALEQLLGLPSEGSWRDFERRVSASLVPASGGASEQFQ